MYKYDGSWICCDSCGGWKCYKHWNEQYGVDLYDYEDDYVDSVYFNCDLCMNLITDAMNIQKKYLDDFKTNYFGEKGVRSKKKSNDNLDSKWVGLSIDVLMEHCEDQEWDKQEIEVNILNDECYNEGKIHLFNYLNIIKRNANSKFAPLFSYAAPEVIQAFVLLKKHMIRYIIIYGGLL